MIWLFGYLIFVISLCMIIKNNYHNNGYINIMGK